MNKKLKVASAAVAVVMAGTMAFGMFGCSGGGNGGNGGKNVVKPNLDESGKLTWAAGTSLNLNIGNSNSKQQGIAYATGTDISGKSYLPDGKEYGAGDLKPAWAALKAQLGVNLVDKYQNESSDKQITTPISQENLSSYDVITGSLAKINENSGAFLNLADYLDYMPNYKAFLEANPVTKYSLTGDRNGGMYAAPYFDGNDDIEKYSMMNRNWVKEILETGDLSTYVKTFKEQAVAKQGKADYANLVVANAASATSYMGTTGSYTVETTQVGASANEQGVVPTTTLKVDYSAALAAAKTSGSGLNTALTEAWSELDVTTLESGNIVDLQNAVINGKAGEVTGGQLAKILREYIKVAYTTTAGAQFYTNLSDVFISASAGWDVDLLVAISRCVVTCAPQLTNAKTDLNAVYAIAGRETTTQRRVDLMALAGELYGVRGLESRYEYTYFNDKGEIQDARASADTYDTINNFSKLTKEGLVYIGTNDMSKKYTVVAAPAEGKADPLTDPNGDYKLTQGEDGAFYDANGKMQYNADRQKVDDKGNAIFTWNKASVKTDASGTQTFMLHDYVQTQTQSGIGKNNTQYNFAPVVNAISKWDTDGDGTRETTMRFTESWRSVKNTGFCVPASITSNKDKLSAVLAFIDYFFSTDGQLLMSYGPQSTNGNTTPNGWWYATEATGVTLDQVADKIADATNYAPAQYSVKKAYKAQYFVYNGKVYTGTPYNGTQVPTLTDLNKDFYLGNSISVNGNNIQQGVGNLKDMGYKTNYTNYARYYIGSTLPIGNKNQGFEYQATANCGINGASIVTTALLNGTLKHVKLTLDEGESPWYLITPTAIPMSQNDQNVMKNDYQTKISGTYFLNTSSTDQTTNILIDILYYGLGSSAYICGQESEGTYATNNTGAKIVEKINGSQFNNRVGVMENGWFTINRIYNLGYELD